ARIAQSTLLTVSGVDRICSFLMSDSLTSFFKPTAYVAATCQTLTFGLIEAAVSESPAEFALGLLALFAADDVLGFLSESEVPNASKASRKNFLFGTIPCLFILLSN